MSCSGAIQDYQHYQEVNNWIPWVHLGNEWDCGKHAVKVVQIWDLIVLGLDLAFGDSTLH